MRSEKKRLQTDMLATDKTPKATVFTLRAIFLPEVEGHAPFFPTPASSVRTLHYFLSPVKLSNDFLSKSAGKPLSASCSFQRRSRRRDWTTLSMDTTGACLKTPVSALHSLWAPFPAGQQGDLRFRRSLWAPRVRHRRPSTGRYDDPAFLDSHTPAPWGRRHFAAVPCAPWAAEAAHSTSPPPFRFSPRFLGLPAFHPSHWTSSRCFFPPSCCLSPTAPLPAQRGRLPLSPPPCTPRGRNGLRLREMGTGPEGS